MNFSPKPNAFTSNGERNRCERLWMALFVTIFRERTVVQSNVALARHGSHSSVLSVYAYLYAYLYAVVLYSRVRGGPWWFHW